MKIGNIEYGTHPLFLAPMEDVTDIGFRKLCKKYGADMMYTEFVAAEAVIRNIKSTMEKIKIDDDERPVGIQIYGRDVDSMVEAAKIVEQAHPDIIDINFGCPVKRVAGKGAGAGLLRNVPLMLDITRAVVNAVSTPVTAKTRLGWDHDNLIITELAEQLQDCGIQALTIHGRTRAQMYTGEADWTLIGEVKNNPRMHIPIIGNGDITTPEEARQAFDRYGVDAVMIGRATFGRPWIFKEIKDELQLTHQQTNPPTHQPTNPPSHPRRQNRHPGRAAAHQCGAHRRVPRHSPHPPPSGHIAYLQGRARLQADPHRHAACRDHCRPLGHTRRLPHPTQGPNHVTGTDRNKANETIYKMALGRNTTGQTQRHQPGSALFVEGG